jgi:hypothetical protein
MADREIDYMGTYAVDGDSYLGLYATHCCVPSAGSREMRRLTGNGCQGPRHVVSPANGISLFLDVWVGVGLGFILEVPF